MNLDSLLQIWYPPLGQGFAGGGPDQVLWVPHFEHCQVLFICMSILISLLIRLFGCAPLF